MKKLIIALLFFFTAIHAMDAPKPVTVFKTRFDKFLQNPQNTLDKGYSNQIKMFDKLLQDAAQQKKVYEELKKYIMSEGSVLILNMWDFNDVDRLFKKYDEQLKKPVLTPVTLPAQGFKTRFDKFLQNPITRSDYRYSNQIKMFDKLLRDAANQGNAVYEELKNYITTKGSDLTLNFWNYDDVTRLFKKYDEQLKQ